MGYGDLVDENGESVKKETGILNLLNEQLRKAREARDQALTEDDIVKANKRIDLLQLEQRYLTDLGLTYSEIIKLREKLDKLTSKSIDAAADAIDDLTQASRESEIDKVSIEIENLQQKFSDINEEAEKRGFTKFTGIFRNIVPKEDVVESIKQLKIQKEAIADAIREREELRLEDSLKKFEDLQADNERERKERKDALDEEKKDLEQQLGLRDEFGNLFSDDLSDPDNLKAYSDAVSRLTQEDANALAAFGETRKAIDKEFDDKRQILQEEKAKRDLKINDETNKQLAANDKKYQDAGLKLRNDYLDARLELQLQYLDELGNLAEQAFDIAADYIERENKLRKDAIDNQIADAERRSDRQFELAKRGVKNTFAFEEEEAAKARKRKIEEERKAAEREKAIRLTSAYFSALEVRFSEAAVNENLEKKFGKTARKSAITAGNAPLFALKDAILAVGLKPFFHGTEDTGSSGITRDQYGVVTGYTHANERVITAKDNKIIGDMSNAELTNLALKYNSGLLMDVSKSMNLKERPSVVEVGNHKLIKEIKEFKDIMRARPVQQWNIDSFGNIIETSYKDGLRTVTRHKNKKPL
jgi:hypothetical protein